MKVSHIVKMDEQVFWELQRQAQQRGDSLDDYLTTLLTMHGTRRNVETWKSLSEAIRHEPS